MRVEAIGIVTRGQPSGTRSCDLCRCLAPELKECRIPVGSEKTHNGSSYWYDLCEGCLLALREAPALPREKAPADRAFDAARERIRRESAKVGCGGSSSRSDASAAGLGA